MTRRSRARSISTAAAATIIVIIIIIGVVAGYYAYHSHKAKTTTTATTTSPGKPAATTTTTTSPAASTTSAPAATTTTTTTTTKPTTTTTTFAGPKALVIETSKAVVVVGPKGAKVPKLPSGKPIIAVVYQVNKTATKPVSQLLGFSSVDPAFYRNYSLDALIIAARKATDPFVREQLYEAIYKISNYEVPILWLGQIKLVRVEWSWLHGRYYHPVLAERYDLLWEDPSAPTVSLGIRNYENNATTYVIADIGWPDTFDPAADYETFGWAIWHNIGDTLVTYWKTDTTTVKPDLAVAWVHDKSGTTWYFVIRGGVKAYDPWHKKTYDITAVDVLFSIWRISRLGLDPSWMITQFVDVNASKVLTEDEFNKILSSGNLIAEYEGKLVKPKSLSELLSFFGYNGPTAGVVMLKLKQPYGAILSILADPFASVIPMKYAFEYAKGLGLAKYQEALKASDYGKNPAAWAKFIGTGEQEPTHLLLHKYPVGTGPYYVAEYQRNSYIVLHYNPYYWNRSLWNVAPYGHNGVPSHKIVIYLINNDANARIQILKRGAADTGVVPLTRIKDVNGTVYPKTNYKIRAYTGGITPDIVFIVLNCMKPPFNNVYVRQALMYAIPFQQIARDVYSGFLARLYGVLPSTFPGHNDNIVIKYTFNLAKAQELIKKSGINPSKYTIEIWYNTGNSQREKIASYLQTIWGQLGFKVTVRALDWPTLLDKTEKGDFYVYIIGWAPDYLDPDDYAGPLLYGGTQFSLLKYIETTNPAQVTSLFTSG